MTATLLAPSPADPRALRASARPRTVVALFAGLSLLFGTLFAFLVPAAWGPDEVAHFDRAYQVSRGGIAPEWLPDDGPYPVYGGLVPAAAEHFTDNYSGPPKQKADEFDPLFTPSEGREQALAAPLAGDPVTAWFPNTAAYSPVPYLPAALGARIATGLDLSVGGAWTLMRMLQVLAYTAVAAGGLWVLRHTRFLWVGLCVALLPTALYQSAVISADSVTNAVVFAFTALVLRATVLDRSSRPLGRAEFWAMLACAAVLPLMKPTYVILSLLLLAVPLSKYPVRRGAGRRPVRALLVLGACALVTLAGFLGWMSLASGTTEAMGILRGAAERHTVRPDDQLHFVLTEPVAFAGVALRTLALYDWDFVVGVFGQMGYGPAGRLNGPFTGALCWLVAAALAFFRAPRGTATRGSTVLFVAVLLLNIAAIFGTLYLSFAPVESGIINGVQGRYFVPLLLLLLGVLAQLVRSRAAAPEQGLRRVEAAVVVLLAASVLLAVGGYVTQVYVPGHTPLP